MFHPGEARADEVGVSEGALRAPPVGHGRPAVGIPILQGGEHVNKAIKVLEPLA